MSAKNEKRDNVVNGVGVDGVAARARTKRKASKESGASGSAAKLKKEVAALKKERDDLKDMLLRRTAEFDNFKKRTENEYAAIVKNAGSDVVSELLPALDDLERSLAAAHEKRDFDGLLGGVELICKNFLQLLQKCGVAVIEAVGREFDPEQHEALLQVDSDEYSSGFVVGEHLRGYSMNGRVIRHSQVLVSK